MSAELTVLLSSKQIQDRVDELGREISRDYPEGPLYLIGILKGSFVFLADLARAISTPCRVEFMGISSYGRDKKSSGEVKVTKDLDVSIEGRHELEVEDIIDSGITLTYLLNVLEQRKPKSLGIVAMLDKPERRQRPVQPRSVGYQIPDEYVIGYGLDYAEEYRNLKDVCVLHESA